MIIIKKLFAKIKDFSKDKNRILCSCLSLIIAGLSVLNMSGYKKTAIIYDGANSKQITTFNSDADIIIKEAGIDYDSNDIIMQDSDNEIINIEIIRAKNVSIHNGCENLFISTTQKTVRDVLNENNIALTDEIVTVPDLDTELYDNIDINVYHKINVTIKDRNDKIEKSVVATTVKEALQNSGVIFGNEDFTTPDLNEAVEDGMTIKLHRVTYKNVISNEKIKYKTKTVYSDDIEKGVKVTSKKGKYGEQKITSKVKYIDGKYDSSEVISKEVVKKPTSAVVKVGTKQSTGSLIDENGNLYDHNGKKVSYKKLLSGTCTAYSYSTGDTTATGEHAERGRVAVNPNVIPYGTKLYICSPDGSVVYGYCTASDTGGALMNGTVLVDLFYNTDEECYNFGRRTMNVYILG